MDRVAALTGKSGARLRRPSPEAGVLSKGERARSPAPGRVPEGLLGRLCLMVETLREVCVTEEQYRKLFLFQADPGQWASRAQPARRTQAWAQALSHAAQHLWNRRGLESTPQVWALPGPGPHSETKTSLPCKIEKVVLCESP